MRVLVTGGAGFIGSHLVRWLVEQGHRVHVLDNLSTGRRALIEPLVPAVNFTHGDIRDRRLLDVVTAGIEIVFHLAALVSVEQSVQQPTEALAVNVAGTVGLLEAAHRAGVQRVVQASTCAVYGNTERLPIDEVTPVNPLSPYAASKLSAEQFGRLYTSLYGLDVVALRFFNVYGPHQDPLSPYAAVIPRFLTRLREGQPITIYGDGQQSRDFIYVQDLVRALWAVATGPGMGGEVFNLGSGTATSVLDMATLLSMVLNVELHVQREPARNGEVRHSCASINKLSVLTDFTPQISLEAGLRLLSKADG